MLDGEGQLHGSIPRDGGKRAAHGHMDAGRLGLALGQHPSIAMEQDSSANRHGAWRAFERQCAALLAEGREVRVVGVFVEGDGDGTYAPSPSCVHEVFDALRLPRSRLAQLSSSVRPRSMRLTIAFCVLLVSFW